MLNRSTSGRIFEIGSDGDDVTVGDISIHHCYRKELRARLDHLQKLNLIIDDEVAIKGDDFFQVPLRPTSSSPTGSGSLCVAQVCRAYVTLAYKHYLITHEYSLGDAQLQYVQKLIQQRLGQYIEQSNGHQDSSVPPLSARDQLYVQRLYELLSFELLRCHSLSLVQQAKFSMAVKRLSLAIDSVPSIDSHFSAGLADALLLSYECYKALASASPPLNGSQHNNVDNKPQEKALQASKLAVNVAHERMRLAVARDSNEEYFLKYADVFLGESVVLDCCTSLVLAYVALGEALELDPTNRNNGEGMNEEMAIASTNDWFVRALQTAEKHHLDEGLISELQRLVNTKRNASNTAKVAVNKANGGNIASTAVQPQQRSVLLLDEDDDDEEENDLDRAFFSHTKDTHNSHEKKANSPDRKSRQIPSLVSNVPNSHPQNMINRPRSALPRLSDMNNNVDNHVPSGVPQTININNSLPHNPANNHLYNNAQNAANSSNQNGSLTVNTFDNDSLHRPRSALSKLGESYNNYTPHSNMRSTPSNNGNMYGNGIDRGNDPHQYYRISNNETFAMNQYAINHAAPPPVSPNNLSYNPHDNFKYSNPDNNYSYFSQNKNSNYNNNDNGASFQTLPSVESYPNPPFMTDNNISNYDNVDNTDRRSESNHKPPLLLHSNSSRAIILLPSNLSVTSDKDSKSKDKIHRDKDKKAARPESGKRKTKIDDNINAAVGSGDNQGKNVNGNAKNGPIRPASAAAVLSSQQNGNKDNNDSQSKATTGKRLLHSQSSALLPPMAAGKTQKNKTLLSRTLSSIPPSNKNISTNPAHNSNNHKPVYNLSEEQLQQQTQHLEEVYLPFFKGMTVEARYQKQLLGEKKALWLPGRIVDADFRNARYTVEFAHGGVERHISAEDIRVNAANSKLQLQQQFQTHVKQVEHETALDPTHATSSSTHDSHKRISAQEVRTKAASEMYVNILRILRETAERRPIREEEKLARQLQAVVPLQALVRGVLARVKFNDVEKEQLIQRKKAREEKAKEAQAKDILLATLLQENEELTREKLAREEQDRLIQLMKEKENEEKQKMLEEEQRKERELEREKAQIEANQQQLMIYTLQQQNEILSQQLEELRKDLKRSLAMLHHQHLLVQQQAQHNNAKDAKSDDDGISQNKNTVATDAKDKQAIEQEEKLQRMMLSIEDRLLAAMQQHQQQLQLQQTQLQHTLLTQSQTQAKQTHEELPESAAIQHPEPEVAAISPGVNEEVLKGVQTEMAQLKDAMNQTLAFVQQSLSLSQLQLQQQQQQQLQHNHHLQLQNESAQQEPDDDGLLYAYFDQFNSSLLRPSHSQQDNTLHRNNTNIAVMGEPDDNDNLENDDMIDNEDLMVVGMGERGLLSAPVSSGGSLFQYNNDMLMQDETDDAEEKTATEDKLVLNNTLMNRSVQSAHLPELSDNNKNSGSDINNNNISFQLEEESSPQMVFLSLSQFELPPYMSTSLSNEEASSPAVQQNSTAYINNTGNGDYINNINNAHSWLIASDSLSVIAPTTQHGVDKEKPEITALVHEVTDAAVNNIVEKRKSMLLHVNEDDEKAFQKKSEKEEAEEVEMYQEQQIVPTLSNDGNSDVNNVAIIEETESLLPPEVKFISDKPLHEIDQTDLRQSIHETAQSIIAQACMYVSHSRSASPELLTFPIKNEDSNKIDNRNIENDIANTSNDIIYREASQCLDEGEDTALDTTNNASFCAPRVEEDSSYLELPNHDQEKPAQSVPDILSLTNSVIYDDKTDNASDVDYNKDPMPLEKTLSVTAITQALALEEEEAITTRENNSTIDNGDVATTTAIINEDKVHHAVPNEAEEEIEIMSDQHEKDAEVKKEDIVHEVEKDLQMNVEDEEDEEEDVEILSLPEMLPLLDVGHLWTQSLQDHTSTSNNKQPTARLLKTVSSLPPLLAIGFSLSSCTAASDQTAVSYNINQAKLSLTVIEKQLDAKESVRLPRGIAKQLYLLHVQQGCTMPFQLDLLPSRNQKNTVGHKKETVDASKLQQIIAHVPKITVKYTLPVVVPPKMEANDTNTTVSSNNTKATHSAAPLLAIVEESASKDEDDDHHFSTNTAVHIPKVEPVLASKSSDVNVPSISTPNDITHEQILSPYQLKKLLKRALTGLTEDKDVVWTPLWHRVSHSLGSGGISNTENAGNNKHLDVALWCRATAVRFDRIVSLVIGYIASLFLQQVQLLVSQASVTVSLTQLLVLLKDEDNHTSSNTKLDSEDIAGHTGLSRAELDKLIVLAQTRVSQQLLQARHLQWQWQHTLSRLRALLRRELRRFDFDKKRLLDFASFTNLHTATHHTKPHMSTTNEFGFTISEKSTSENNNEEDIDIVFDSDSDTENEDDNDNSTGKKKKSKRDSDSGDHDDARNNECKEDTEAGDDDTEGPRKQRRKTMSMSFTSAQLRQYTTVRRSSRHTNNNGVLSETPLAETADKELFSALHTLASTSIKDALTQFTLNLTDDKTVYNAAGAEVKLRQPRSPYKHHSKNSHTYSNSDGCNITTVSGNDGMNLVEDDDEEEENEDDETLAAYHAAYVRQQIQALWQPTPLSTGAAAKGGAAKGGVSPSPNAATSSSATWVDKISKMLLEFVHSLHVTNMLLAAPQMAQKVALAAQAALEASLDLLLQNSESNRASSNLWQKLWFHQDVLLQMVGKKMAGTFQKKIEDFILSYSHYDEPEASDDPYAHNGDSNNYNDRNLKNSKSTENEENESDEDDFEGTKTAKGPMKRFDNKKSNIHDEEDDDRFMLHFLHLAQNTTSNTNKHTPEEVLQGGGETAMSVFLQALQLQQTNSDSVKTHVPHLTHDNQDVKRFQDFVLGQRFILVGSPSCKTLRQSLTHHASSMKLRFTSSSGKLK